MGSIALLPCGTKKTLYVSVKTSYVIQVFMRKLEIIPDHLQIGKLK